MENYTPINGKYKLLKSHTNSYITATSSKKKSNIHFIRYWHIRINSILKLKYCPSKEAD